MFSSLNLNPVSPEPEPQLQPEPEPVVLPTADPPEGLLLDYDEIDELTDSLERWFRKNAKRWAHEAAKDILFWKARYPGKKECIKCKIEIRDKAVEHAQRPCNSRSRYANLFGPSEHNDEPYRLHLCEAQGVDPYRFHVLPHHRTRTRSPRILEMSASSSGPCFFSTPILKCRPVAIQRHVSWRSRSVRWATCFVNLIL